MKTFMPFLIIVALTFGGCAHSVITSTYTSEPYPPNTGVVYSLPKTRLKVTITYTIQELTRIVNGIPEDPQDTPPKVAIVKPVVIEPILAPDPDNTFVLSGEGLTKGANLDSSFKFQISDNQMLAGVTAEATDKAPEIVQGLVCSGISILKMAVGVPRELTPPMKKVANRLDAINDEIGEIAAGSDLQKLEKIDALLKEQQMLLSFAAKYSELNTARVKDRDVVFTKILDLADFEWTTDHWTANVKAQGAMLGPIDDRNVPQVTVVVYATEKQRENAAQSFSPAGSGEKGVIYRVPTPLRTKVTVAPGDIVVFDDYIQFAQVGPFNKVEARYKAWAKRKTTITFSAATGSMKEYGVEATSSTEAISKALDTSLGKVQTALADIKKVQDAAEAKKKTPEQTKLSDLEMQKRLVDAEVALIKAQQELQRLISSSGSQ